MSSECPFNQIPKQRAWWLLSCYFLVCLFLTGVVPAQTSSEPATAVFVGSKNANQPLRRIYPVRKKKSNNQSSIGDQTASVGTASSGGPDLQYYGGAVISNVQVVLVYWGNNVDPETTTGIPGFYSAVTASNWFDELSEYSTNDVTPVGGGTNGNQSIGRGTLAGVYSITPSAANSGTTVDDTQIQAELLAQIDAGHLPGPATDNAGNATTLYMIYFPPGVTITLQGASSCQQFCAYHGTVNSNNLDIPYGVMPDLGPTTACYSACAGGTEFEDLTTVSSHELAESITDPGVGLALTFGPPLAWYDSIYGEIGDICNASGVPANQAVLDNGYTVQKIWSNLQEACVSAPPTFALSAPSTILSGTQFTVALSVQSSAGNALNPPYAGTVTFASTDGTAILPGNYTFTPADSNTHTFTNAVTLKAAGQQTITATDTQSGGFVGTAQVNVTARTFPYFSLAVPNTAVSGVPFTFTVTELTPSGTVNTGYTGTVHFTSSDPQASLPANATLTNGTGTFTATLRTSGSETITATDTVNSNITGASPNIATSGPATHLSLGTPSSAAVGVAFSFTVTALDQSNNPATSYKGTVHFTSSDSQALLPTNATLSNGTGTFSVTLSTVGNQTITATDTLTSTIAGTSPNISTIVAATHFVVNAPSLVTAGNSFNFTVTAVDQSNNVATGYTGIVQFSSSDSHAVLPANTTLTSGTGTFGAILNTAGTQTIVAVDTVNSTLTGSSGGISVTTAPPAAVPNISPNPGTYNTPQTVTVTDSTPGVTIYYTTDGSYPTTASRQYTGPITISATTTLQAIAAGNGYSASLPALAIYRITALTPNFSLNPGTYNNPQSVTITDAMPGVSIYYTVDGSNPTTSSPLYTGPITISTTTTLQAIAAGNGYAASLPAFGIYRIVAQSPNFSPNPWTYGGPQTVTITDPSPGVAIYYTTDGSNPTTASPQYTGPITIATTTTLQAIAAGNGYAASLPTFGIYRITAQPPLFSPNPGNFTTPQTVTISDVSPGVTIYYTTNGSAPSTSSPQYTGPITISTTTNLQAIAAGNGFVAGPVTSGVYTFPSAAVPAFSPVPGTYSGPQTVTISDTTPGVTIYCTTDGSTPTTSSPKYTSPIVVSTSTTLQAIAAGNGYGQSPVGGGLYRIATTVPTFSLNPGTYNAPQTVTISDATAGVTIYYTTDGSTPTTSSPQYTGPITISTTTTLQAIAAGTGHPASLPAFGIYRIVALMPTYSPNPATYNSPQAVTITDASPGVAIYYTTDGSSPTTSSPQYTGPITISTTTTLQAIAAGNGYAASLPASGIYRIAAQAPNFSPNPATYNTPQTITISDATPGVTIYYTLDGSSPTTSSAQYTGAITISTTATLQAIAVGNGYAASQISFGTYRIVALTPTYSPNPGTYHHPQTVTISDASPGVKIYYTTDGSTPTTSSPLYTSPITISTITTLRAIAVGNGYAASVPAYGIYKIN